MKQLLGEFKTFALSGNLVDIAVGIAIGIAFASVVDSLVEGVITPLVGAIFGQPEIAYVQDIGKGRLEIGVFLTQLLNFLLLALVVLFLVKGIKKLTGKEVVGAQGSRECDHCMSSVPVAASVCMHCTRDLEPLVA